MSIERDRFLETLDHQSSFCGGKSPLSAKLLAAMRSDLSSGKASWFAKLEDAWQGRDFNTYYESRLLLLALLHYRALLGDERLKTVFPTCGGKSEHAEIVVIDYLNSAPQDFWDEMKDLRVQTNEPSRAVGWLLVACVGFCLRRTPFHLVDMGTSGGLNLIGDYLPRKFVLKKEDGGPAPEPEHWKDAPYPVLSRLGLDAAPRILSNREDRLWLKACIRSDDAERQARFDQTVELFLKLSLELAGPKLERCDFASMPEFIASKVRPHPEEGLLLFNSQATDFLSNTDYEQFKNGVAKTLRPWGDRGFWAELELPREQDSGFYQLTVHRLKNGKLESKVLATMAPHPKEVRLKSGWDFLAPLKPPRPPRNTREEPPKNLQPGRYKFP
jgi:hypothetical protein